MREARYACVRFFLQKSLLADFSPDASAPNVFFMATALNNRLIQIGGSTYAIRIMRKNGNLFYGKLSKLSYVENYDLTPLDVVENQIENWPYVEFLCDPLGNQVFIVRLKFGVIDDASRAKNVLGKIFSEILKGTGYAVSFEPLIRPAAFWSIIGECERIYSIKLHLLSPNLFGANSKANEMLKELVRDVNNTDTEIKVLNKKGDLKVKEENFGSYITYAEQGGGTWSAKIQDAKGQRTVYSGMLAAEYRAPSSIEDDSERLDYAYDKAKEDIKLP